MTRCPDSDSLAQLLTDEAPPDVSFHLQECENCRQRLDEMTLAVWQATSELTRGDVRPEFLRDLAEAVVAATVGAPNVPRAPLPALDGYAVLGEIGRGGSSVVYSARQLSLNRVVALKLLRVGGHAGAKERARFQAEASAAARLQHPNIVAVYEIGEWQSEQGITLPFLALEYVEGGTLARLMAGQPQQPRQAARLVELVARAVDVAHRQHLVHRDLKPANILLQRPGEAAPETPISLASAIPKIADFGLVMRLDGQARLTESGEVVGTPVYMAPEQARGQREMFRPSVDIYALGAILYESLTGRPPFQAASVAETLLLVAQGEPVPVHRLNPAVPLDLATICMKCLEREPRQRYGSADQLADDLTRFLSGELIRARPVGAVERVLRWARRRRAAAALIAVSVLATLALAGGGVFSYLAIARTLAHEQQTAYFDSVAAASGEFYADNVAEAVALLDDCRPELRGWEWHYLSRLCRGAPAVVRHRPESDDVLIRPDGSVLVYGTRGGLYFRDVDSGRLIQHQPTQTHLQRLAWIGKGEWLAAASATELLLCNADSGAVEARLDAAPNIQCLASCRRASLLASVTREGIVEIWDCQQRLRLHVLGPHSLSPGAYRVLNLAFHPDGSLLACAAEETVTLWRVADGKRLESLRHKDSVLGMAWSPCGQWLVTAARNPDNRRPDATIVHVWNAHTWEEARTQEYLKGGVARLTFRPDGRQLAGKCAGGVQRWSWPELRELAPIRLPGDRHSVSYSGDSKRLATLDSSSVRVFDADTGQEPFNARVGERGRVMAMALHPSKRLAACASGTGVATVIDLRDGSVIKQWDEPANEIPFSLAWDAAGSAVAAGLGSKVVLWRLDEPGFQVFQGHQDRIHGIAFAQDGQELITASLDHTIRFWDPDTRLERHRIAGLGKQGRWPALAVDQQQKLLAAVDDPTQGKGSGRICIWDVSSRQPLGELWFDSSAAPPCIAFDPLAQRLAGGGPTEASSIRVWDLASRQEIARCRGHSLKVTSVAWSSDGRRLVSSSDDGTVRLWEPQSGRLLLTLRGHRGGVNAAAFTADGQQLVSAGWDGAIRVWDATPLVSSFEASLPE